MAQNYYWAGFVFYSATVIFIGFYVWWRDKNLGKEMDNAAYWEASRNLSSWAVGLSISASMMSVSWSCVYGVQLFYWYGLGGAWLLIIPWLITMGGFFIFAPRFRRMQAFSQPQLLEKRFGPRSRQLLAPALIVVFITWAGAEIFAAGKIIAPFLGLPLDWMLLLITLIVAAYSYTGGFEAVVSTDKIQFVLVALFITAISLLAWHALPRGISLLKQVRPPKQLSPYLLISPGIALILMTFIAYLPGWLIETDVWIRLQAARSDRSARQGIFIASLNSLIFVGLMPFIIGSAALLLYPAHNGVIPPSLQDGSLIFTRIMQDYAPVWLNVLLTVGLIAAAMSTIDTCGNVVALSFSHDLLEPALRDTWTAKKLNRLARLSSLSAIFISFIYALFTDSLWDIFYLSSGILTTTVFIPVLASFFKSTTPRQIHFSIGFGFLATLIFYFLEKQGALNPWQPGAISKTGLGYILWGFLFSTAGFLIGKISKKESGHQLT